MHSENITNQMSKDDEARVPLPSKSILEAILFAASEPISVKQFRYALPGLSTRAIRKGLAELRDDYEELNRSFHLFEIANGYQICTRSAYSEWVKKFYTRQINVTLSSPALETLSIVAYKQPVTRAEVAQIRGVNSDSALNSLIEKGLVCIAGRKEGAGRSLLFSTTEAFLQQFGLKDISKLPSLEEIEQLLETSNGTEAAKTGAEASEHAGLSQEKNRIPNILPLSDSPEEVIVEIEPPLTETDSLEAAPCIAAPEEEKAE